MEDPSEAGPNHEQKKWEEEHVRSALMSFGAKDAKSKQAQKASRYDIYIQILWG